MWTGTDITVDRFISQSDHWICSEYLRLRRNLAGHFEVRERCLTLTGTCPLIKFTESLTQLADLHTFYEKKNWKCCFFVINHQTVWLFCLLFYILLRHLLRNFWKTFEYNRHSRHVQFRLIREIRVITKWEGRQDEDANDAIIHSIIC